PVEERQPGPRLERARPRPLVDVRMDPAHVVAALGVEELGVLLEKRHLDATAAEPRRHRQPGEAAADDAGATAGAPGVAERPRQVQRAHRLQMDRHPAVETAANEDAGVVGDERVRKDRLERPGARLARSPRRAYSPRMANAPDS